jgi:hypothetical protein
MLFLGGVPVYLPLCRSPCSHDDIRITLYVGLSHCHIVTGSVPLFTCVDWSHSTPDCYHAISAPVHLIIFQSLSLIVTIFIPLGTSPVIHHLLEVQLFMSVFCVVDCTRQLRLEAES